MHHPPAVRHLALSDALSDAVGSAVRSGLGSCAVGVGGASWGAVGIGERGVGVVGHGGACAALALALESR